MLRGRLTDEIGMPARTKVDAVTDSESSLALSRAFACAERVSPQRCVFLCPTAGLKDCPSAIVLITGRTLHSNHYSTTIARLGHQARAHRKMRTHAPMQGPEASLDHHLSSAFQSAGSGEVHPHLRPEAWMVASWTCDSQHPKTLRKIWRERETAGIWEQAEKRRYSPVQDAAII